MEHTRVLLSVPVWVAFLVGNPTANGPWLQVFVPYPYLFYMVALLCWYLSYSAMHLLRLTSALSFMSLAVAWTTYVVPHSEGNDDTPALAAAFAANPKLATNATILFQHGVTYNIFTPIRFPPFENVIVSVQGNLSYAADVQATQGENLLNDVTWVSDIDIRHSFLPAIVGSSVGSAAPFRSFLYALNIPFSAALFGILVSSLPFPSNGNFIPIIS